MRLRTALIIFAVVTASLFLYFYRPPVTDGVTEQMVQMGLRGLGYEYCGTYTLRPGVESVMFSKTFNGDVKCFIIVKRPGNGYMFEKPHVTWVMEPPSEETVYRYSAGMRFFYPLQVLSIDEYLKPFSRWGAGTLNRTVEPPPRSTLQVNDDIYVFFSYRPEEDGFPVKITLMIRAGVIEGEAPPPPSLLERGVKRLAEQLDIVLSGRLADTTGEPQPEQKKLAVQLGIKDIKVLMSYLGYELCGEFTAEKTDKTQKVELEVDIDLNEGKACYVLIHPPPGRNAFLIIRHEHRTLPVGDMDQLREYTMKLDEMGLNNNYILTTHYMLRSAFDVLGLGRIGSPSDVEKPYSSGRSVLGSGGSGTLSEFKNNAPILIYFAYKGDREAFGEPLRFWLKTYTMVEFRIIPALEVVVVD